jgi:hypothetical protein
MAVHVTKQDQYNIPIFPNVYIHAVTAEKVQEYFGPDKYITIPDNWDGMPTDIKDVTLAMQSRFSQKHPFWAAFRLGFALTGSLGMKYMLAFGPTAGAGLGLGSYMIDHSHISKEWHDQRMRYKYSKIPPHPMDVNGLCMCECGKTHEAAAAGTIMMHFKDNPGLKFEEVGRTPISAAMVNAMGCRNVFDDDKPFEEEGFPNMADSPDFKMTLLLDSVMVIFAGEIKCKTEYLKFFTPLFSGAQFMRTNCSEPGKRQKASLPFAKPTNYYMVQTCVFHPIALQLHDILFASHTTLHGLNMFRMRFDVRYASLVMSFLRLIYNSFILKDMDVPTDWPYRCNDIKIRSAHAEFIRLTNKICDTTPLWIHVPAEVTKQVAELMRDPDHDTKSEYLPYPHVPEWTAPMIKLTYHARALFPDSDLYWISEYDCMKERWANICKICEYCPYVSFALPICDALRLYHDMPVADPPIFTVDHALMERAEKFMAKVLELVSVHCRDAATHRPGQDTVDDPPHLQMVELARQTVVKLGDIWTTAIDQTAKPNIRMMEKLNALQSDKLSWSDEDWWLACAALVCDYGASKLQKIQPLTSHRRTIMQYAMNCFSHPSLMLDLLKKKDINPNENEDEEDETSEIDIRVARVIAVSSILTLLSSDLK